MPAVSLLNLSHGERKEMGKSGRDHKPMAVVKPQAAAAGQKYGSPQQGGSKESYSRMVNKMGGGGGGGGHQPYQAAAGTRQQHNSPAAGSRVGTTHSSRVLYYSLFYFNACLIYSKQYWAV